MTPIAPMAGQDLACHPRSRRPARRLGWQLVVVGLFCLPVVGPASAQPVGGACGPDLDCIRACRHLGRTALLECFRQGHTLAECRARIHELRMACMASDCEPMPSCEQRCRVHGKRLLKQCLQDGADLERCRAEAEMAAQSCIEYRCRSCVCPDVYDPVCGDDGMTYENACEAGCAGVQIRHDGPCEPKCEPLLCDVFCEFGHRLDPNGCPTCECNPPPGCESDDDCEEDQVCRKVCYRRLCSPDAADLPGCEDCIGVCSPRPSPCLCPEIYDPVCGVDGRTYSNDCFARCSEVEIAYEGECQGECRTNTDCREPWICFPPTHRCQPECAIQCFAPDPVCGVDGVTYVCGEPDAHCHGVEVAYPGECRPECVELPALCGIGS